MLPIFPHDLLPAPMYRCYRLPTRFQERTKCIYNIARLYIPRLEKKRHHIDQRQLKTVRLIER